MLFSFNDISLITYLGMFIIPVGLATLLMGFLFKKKNVDFVLSKPVSRKMLYFTNVVGGILLILLLFLVNSIILGLFNLSSMLVIPFKLIIDYFLYFTVAYIFVFAISILAISIAGNFMSSIVLILIIVCLFPFLTLSNMVLKSDNTESYIKCDSPLCEIKDYSCYDSKECSDRLKNKEYAFSFNEIPKNNFTAPIMFLNNEELSFEPVSLAKMFILSIVYLGLGYIIFLKRKMENNEISFKNDLMHYVVKGITLVPIGFLTYILINQEALTGFIISIVGIVIYSIIYDFITRKEIYKFLQSTFISLVVFGVLIGIYTLEHKIGNTQVLDIKDIDYFVYESNNYDIKIENRDLINLIVRDNRANANVIGADMYANNKRYNTYLRISDDTYELLKEEENRQIEAYNKEFDIENFDYVSDLKLDKKLKNLIIETYNSKDFENQEKDALIKVYDYKNHDYQVLKIAKGINKELDNVLHLKSKQAVNNLKDTKQNIYFSIYDNFSALDKYVLDYVLISNLDSFIDYLENDNNKLTEDQLIIYVYGGGYNFSILIGDRTSFIKEFNEYKLKLENDSNYQNLVEEYLNYSTKLWA